MTKSRGSALEKLARFRQLSEDKAVAALRTAARTASEAAELLDDAVRDCDAITEWKTANGTAAGIPLDFYAYSLELEAHSSENVERKLVLKREATESRDAALDVYVRAANAVHLVERRSERRLKEESISSERVVSDLVSDLWLARRLHDHA